MPDIKLPDGRIIKNVPAGTTKEDLTKKLISKGLLKGNEDFIQQDKSLLSKIGTGAVEGLAGFTEGLARSAVGATQFGAELLGQKDFAQKIGQQVQKEREQEKDDPTARKVGRFIGQIAPALPVGSGSGLIISGLKGGAFAEAIDPTRTGTIQERAEEVAKGGLLGAGTGAALKGLGKVGGVIKRQFVTTKPEDIIAKGIRPEDAKPFLEKLEQGEQAILPDIAGDELKGLTRSVAKISGSKDIVADALENRSFKAVERVTNQLAKDISPVDSYFGNLDDLAKARSEIAAPLYKKAFDQGTTLDINKNKELFEKIAPDIADARNKFRLGKATIKIDQPTVNRKELLDKAAGSSGINEENALFEVADSYKKALTQFNQNKPKRLIQYIKETGGISDYKGELKTLGIDNKTLPGFLRKEGTGGVGIDDVGEKLQEAGFFQERPTVNQVLDLIERDVKQSNVFVPSNNQNLYDEAAEYLNQFDRYGIDIDAINLLRSNKSNFAAQELNKGRIADNSIVMLDAAKKSLDDKIGKAIRQGEKQEARVLQGIKKELVNKLDELNPDYKKARQIFSDFASIENSQQLGLDINKLRPEEITRLVKEMNPAERDAFRIGVRESLDKIVQKTPFGVDPARRIFGNSELRNKIKAAIGDNKKYQRFESIMKEEIAAAETKFKVLGGSRSDFNISTDDQFLDKMASGLDIARGNKAELIRAVVTSLKNRAAGLNSKNSKQVAEILVDRNKGIDALQKIIKQQENPSQKRILEQLVESLQPQVGLSQAIPNE